MGVRSKWKGLRGDKAKSDEAPLTSDGRVAGKKGPTEYGSSLKDLPTGWMWPGRGRHPPGQRLFCTEEPGWPVSRGPERVGDWECPAPWSHLGEQEAGCLETGVQLQPLGSPPQKTDGSPPRALSRPQGCLQAGEGLSTLTGTVDP